VLVATADDDAVEARLRPQLGQWLCVLPSPRASDQLDIGLVIVVLLTAPS